MKKKLLIIFMLSKAYTQCLGDINQDNTIDTLDIFLVSQIILYNQLPDEISDINYDSTTNIIDILILADIILDENGGEIIWG